MKPVMLVVDDEPLLRMEIAELAEKEGFDVVEASNSAQARHILEGRSDIRVVFTDIRMPGDMDGLELAHLIRKRWPPTTIVICSGNARPSAEDMPTDAVFLSKPCASPSTAELLSDIREKVSVASN
jgi:two-component system, response regulator PdtaR